MKREEGEPTGEQEPESAAPRHMRADAQRKMGAIIQAATEVFAKSGVDAPVREIAERAGVGIGTVYRHFPQRSDLIVAVFQTQVDACADAAPVMAGKYPPGEALARWMQRYVDFVVTKRGLAAALHSGDSSYVRPAGLFQQAAAARTQDFAGRGRCSEGGAPGIEANDLLRAVATLCRGPHDEELVFARRMVDLLVDGLRYGASGVTGRTA